MVSERTDLDLSCRGPFVQRTLTRKKMKLLADLTDVCGWSGVVESSAHAGTNLHMYAYTNISPFYVTRLLLLMYLTRLV